MKNKYDKNKIIIEMFVMFLAVTPTSFAFYNICSMFNVYSFGFVLFILGMRALPNADCPHKIDFVLFCFWFWFGFAHEIETKNNDCCLWYSDITVIDVVKNYWIRPTIVFR